MTIPLIDLRAQHVALLPELRPVLEEVQSAEIFAVGPQAEQLEADFAACCRTRHRVAVNSGTTALFAGLLASGLMPGDEVIAVPKCGVPAAGP